jgi:NADH:ubiquinone oxidoreductase subunit F (NADH-binding)/NADH:ubiquinone oxidoreductase subunit E
MQAQPYRRTRHDPQVASAARQHGRDAESLLPILQHVQHSATHLSKQAIGAVSDQLGLPDAQSYGVASFYSMLSTEPRERDVIRVCDGPVCCLYGGEEIRIAFANNATGNGVYVERTSCLGLCDRAPAALVGLEPCGPINNVELGSIQKGWRGDTPTYPQQDGEVRVAMNRIGKIDPDDIQSAIELGAYESLKSALESEPINVLDAVSKSGLQGRGGAAFPTGRKWQIVANASATPKYIVCNADESEPAAFKDRVLMEGDPHLLLEGMALAAYAVGSSQGYIYIRGEYETAERRLERAIEQAERAGWLGEKVGGSDFSFAIQVHRGAGAYICGEETALLESMEGRRGEPRIRPPYPTTHGLHGLPTVVNNVETLCKVPAIVGLGPTWYQSLGNENSPGTKLFTVTGHINRPGVFEAPFGITLRQVIDQFGGEMKSGSTFKMALTGGAAGTIVGESALDVPLDFASQQHGVSLGAGAILVMDQSVPVVRLLGWLLHFFESESCGKCTPCREGTQQAHEIVRRMQRGNGKHADVVQLVRLSKMLRLTSLCGLGQSVAWPIDSALNNFPDEFQCSD